MKRRDIALGVVLLWTVAVVASADAPAAAEEPPVEVGWWSSNPTASAPERGLAVSAGPNGTITLAALRAPVDGAALETATLTLTEEGGVQQSGAQLKVCATPNAWTSGPKQPSDKAPRPECDRAGAPLARNTNGTWSADVTNVLSSPLAGDPATPSLMIVPAGSGAVPVGFEVRFQPPRLEVTRRAGGSSSATSSPSSSSNSSVDFDSSGPASAPASGSASPSSPSPSSSFASSTSRSSSSFEGPPLASFSPAQLSGTVEASPTAQDSAAIEVLAAASEPAAVAPTQARVASTTSPASGSRTVQALFFIVVATVVGVGVGFGHARLRPEGATT